MFAHVGRKAPFLGRWSTAEVGQILIKSGRRLPFLWRRFWQYGSSSAGR